MMDPLLGDSISKSCSLSYISPLQDKISLNLPFKLNVGLIACASKLITFAPVGASLVLAQTLVKFVAYEFTELEATIDHTSSFSK